MYKILVILICEDNRIRFVHTIVATKKPFAKIQCSACKKTNYFTKKTKATAEKKLELKKFCSACRKHTPHKEGKR